MDKTPKVRSKTPPLSAYKSPEKVQARTIIEPQRMAFPGIYSHPSEIAAEAASRVAPESPNLKRLFGVNRDDLYEIGKDLRGNLPGTLPGAAVNPRGSVAAESIMNPKNVQRILDVNAEAEKFPALVRGMDPWYVMTPYYQRMVELLGPERAAFEYRLQNTLMGMASPGSEVTTEIPRGSAAYFLHKQGRFPEFMQFMGVPAAQREAADVPKDIIDVPGHMYHKTAQALPMDKFLRTGEFTMTTPKVPMYIEASGVPETGFQTQTPVGDAHWSRAVGLADTRGAKTSKGKEVVPGGSVSNPEMTQLAPWWRDKIAKQLGIESVPAQARTWGAFSGQTGVTTPIGSPKLEMIADKIVETAQRLGVSPETARDMVMTGEARMGKAHGGAVHKAEGGMVDSPPEEAIKNTITDPQAFRMLDMDLANLALMNQRMQPRRMSGGGSVQMQHGGKMRVTHGSATKITPSIARSFDVTSDPAYAIKRAGDKMDALNIQGPPMLNNFDVPADKLLRMDETPYSAEQVNAMRKFWSKLPADTSMTGEQIYDLMTQNRQHFDNLMPGITKAAGFAGYQRPATGTGGRDNWFRITNPEHIEAVKRKGGAVHMAGGGRPPLRSLDEVPSDEYLKAELARINAAPTVRANSADETANYARYVAERAGQPIEMPARPDYTPGFSVLEKPTYGSEVPGTTPTIDQQRYELTMKGQQDAANKRYRAQQGDALAGMDPTGTLAVTDAARTMGLGMLALPVHAGRSAFHYLQHGNMKDAPTGMDYEEFMSPRTAEGAELVEEIGTAGSRLTGSEMGFGLNPTLWAYAPPTVAQMRAGLKLGAERAAPVLGKIDQAVRSGYESGAIPQPGLSIKNVTPKALAPANEQGFYSPTEAAALNLQRKSGNGQAFLNDILKGENVRAEEISGMGLDTWLKDKKEVTAAEVQDYIAKNKLKLGETRLQETPDFMEFLKQKGFSTEDAERMLFKAENDYPEAAALRDEYLSIKPTKFDRYTLPGGENYREVVITMPTKEGKYRVEPVIEEGYHVDEPTWKIVDNEGKTYRFGYKDIQSATKSANELNEEINPSYRSSHFDEPNVFAHLRMSDRVTDGKKTLLVDEVQSDWHQAGREQGYKLPPEATAPMDSEYRALIHKNADAVAQGLTPDPKDVARAKMLEEQLIQSDSSKIPNAPYKEDWYQLALRRAVKEAIDGGYDRVALPTGARVNERFNLSKYVESISHQKNPDGTYKVVALDKDGSIALNDPNVPQDKLSSIVGKDVAQKIIDSEGKSYPEGSISEGMKKLSGLELEVGGEGNRKYYDEIYPNYLKKFGKKYGANVGTTYAKTDINEWPFPIQIESDGKNFWLHGRDPRIDKEAKLSGNFNSYEDANKFRDSMYEGNTEPLHYMDITPAMRKEFSTGIHMKRGGKVSFADSLDAMRHELTQRQ